MLQVQFLRFYTKHHLCVDSDSERCLCGKEITVATELFDIPEEATYPFGCGCLACLKILSSKIEKESGVPIWYGEYKAKRRNIY
jgi:hypothetical protein